jgi:hypothetical protein
MGEDVIHSNPVNGDARPYSFVLYFFRDSHTADCPGQILDWTTMISCFMGGRFMRRFEYSRLAILGCILVLNLGLVSCSGDKDDPGNPGNTNNTVNFRDNGNGTVTNTTTGLEWQLGSSPQKLFYHNPGFGYPAEEYCENLALDGGGWRLPTLDELMSLVDTSRDDPTIVDPFRPYIYSPNQFYWTSTDAPTAACMYAVFFDNGRAAEIPAAQSWQVRCCREP